MNDSGSSGFRAGVATADITPPVGYSMTGYGWTGQPSIKASHGIKHHTIRAKIRDRLSEADLLVLSRALNVFAEEELDAMRQQARERGERLKPQKGSDLAFGHDPLTREDFGLVQGLSVRYLSHQQELHGPSAVTTIPSCPE